AMADGLRTSRGPSAEKRPARGGVSLGQNRSSDTRRPAAGCGAIMKTVILAGGAGTRLAEESELKPKPMVEIGGRPILWHIMRRYAAFGFQEFVLALGYKGELIKQFFMNY